MNIDLFQTSIDAARAQALEWYQQGELLYPEYHQIDSHLCNARSYLLLAAFQPSPDFTAGCNETKLP